MPIDRESVIRQAEKLNREGKLDQAIAEYVRLVDEQPHDWNSINALGDLYLRSGKVDRAVSQFIQIADHLFDEGFFPKAAAVYKKALKAKPDHEHAILRLADIAAAQELLADARGYLRRLWELRSERGDDRGAAECLIRLASLPEADVDTRVTGARAARVLGDAQQAISLFRSVAEELEKGGRGAEALDALMQVAALDPSNTELRRELANRYLAAGQPDEAAQLLDAETVGSDPDLLLARASLDLSRKDDAAAWATLTRFVGCAPDRSADVLRLAGELGRAGDPDRAFTCASIVVDEAVLRGDWDRAIDVVQSFLVHGHHIPALVKLVHVSSDAGVEEVLQEAQERLVDAYLEQGQGLEAQSMAEALLARAPGSPVHAQRLRRALELSGADDPDEDVRRVLARFDVPAEAPVETPVAMPQAVVDESDSIPLLVVDEVEPIPVLAIEEPDSIPFLVLDDDLLTGIEPEMVADPEPVPEPRLELLREPDIEPMPAPAAGIVAAQPQAPPAEIDLSDFMAALGSGPGPAGAPAVAPADDAIEDLSDLEALLNKMRPRGTDYETVTEAASSYERGVQRIERGLVAEGLEELKEAAYTPAFRFPAAARLGREYIKLGQTQEGIEWLSRAAEMPPSSRDAGLAVLYDLSVALESLGESARCLAVLMEINADDPTYRDVPQRIVTLSRQEDERRG